MYKLYTREKHNIIINEGTNKNVYQKKGQLRNNLFDRHNINKGKKERTQTTIKLSKIDKTAANMNNKQTPQIIKIECTEKEISLKTQRIKKKWSFDTLLLAITID